MAATRITDDTTRAELAECLANLNRHAKRQPHVVRLDSQDRPTAWDRAHRQIDAVLDDWLAASDGVQGLR